ncbi:MAG: CotH kinase family protein, partial [Bacteroidota bacterium]
RSDWGLDYQAYQPVNVYINGKFFALMFFRERHDRHYYANNLGADPDEVSVIRRWGGGAEINPGDPFYQRFNSTANFFSSSNFADTAAVQAAARLIDIENYFHYLYYNHHIVNTDWPYNNYKMAHPGGDEKWRFCVYDNDFGFGDQNFYQSGLAILMQGGQEGYWLPRLMENDSLREYFINYYLDLLNTEFDPKDFEESLKAVEAKLRPDIDAHLAHWVPRLQANGNFVQPWEEYIDNIYPGFSRMRIQARKGLGSAFNLNKEYNLSIEISPSTAADIQLNTLTLQDFPWSGRYLHGNPIQVRVKARPGYRFVGWTDPLLPDTSFLRIDFEQSCTLTALFERDNSYQPELVINEVVYDDSGLQNGSNDWLELHNASSQAIQLDNWVLGDETDENRFVFPAGTSLQAGGFTIICRDPAAFLGAYPGTKIIPRALGFGLGKEDQIRIWDQNGILIDSLAYQDQAPWPILAEGRGGILALRDPALIVNYPQSWISREDYRPTPGRANQIINTLGDERRISCIHFDAELFP